MIVSEKHALLFCGICHGPWPPAAGIKFGIESYQGLPAYVLHPQLFLATKQGSFFPPDMWGMTERTFRSYEDYQGIYELI